MLFSLLFCDEVYVFVTFLVLPVLEGFGGFQGFWSQHVFGEKQSLHFSDQNVLD